MITRFFLENIFATCLFSDRLSYTIIKEYAYENYRNAF